MDDLQLVRELGDETPLPSLESLAPARAVFVAGMRPRRRAGIIAASLVAVAAAAAAVVVVVPKVLPGPAPDHAVLISEAPVDAAVELLNHAATVARSKPEVVPRPDQFYYVKWGRHEVWRSVDGTRPGKVLVGDREIEPQPGRAYRDDLPTNPEEMAAYLRRAENGRDLIGVVSNSYLPAKQRAAMFEVISRAKGLIVVRDGDKRLGVLWPSQIGPNPESMTLMFDRETHEFLGLKGAVIEASGFVDEVGQRP